MPSIITTPTRSRMDSRGMTEAEVQEYIELLLELDETQSVTVDDSITNSYEKSYAKGERVRTAAKKFNLVPEDMAIVVMARQTNDAEEDEKKEFTALLSLKNA